MSEAYTDRFFTSRPEDWNNFDPAQDAVSIPKQDPVNHPGHYCKGGVECIDAIRASMSKDAFAGYCKGNCLKYLWRYEVKNKRVEDLKKAQVYLGWLIETEEKTA
jgi:hypothetical protein